MSMMIKSHVLIVANDLSLRAVLHETITSMGYTAGWINSNQPILQQIQQQAPTVILLDLMPSNTTGLHFLRSLALQPSDPYAVIVMSAQQDYETIQACYEAGATFFVRKPILWAELAGVLRNAVALKQYALRLKSQASELASLDEKLVQETDCRQKTELALVRSETRLQLIAQNLWDVIMLFDADCIPRYISPAIERISGHPPETLIGNLNLEYFHPDEIPAFQEFWQNLLQQPPDEPQTLVHRFKHASGSWLYLEFIGNNLLSDPEVRGVVANVRDITTRKQLEAAQAHLLEAEREQRLLANTLTDVTMALTAQTDHDAILDEILRQAQRLVPYVTANIALVRGNEVQVVLHRGYEAFGAADFMAGMTNSMDDFLIERTVMATQQAYVVPDTRLHHGWVVLPATSWIRSHIAVPIMLHQEVIGFLRLDGDKPNHFSEADVARLQPLASAAAIALENASLVERLQTELCERQTMEVHLRQSEALKQDILDSLASQVAVLNKQGTIMLVNKAWEHFTHDNTPATHPDPVFVGMNYLAVCKQAENLRDPYGSASYHGLRAVMNGEQSYYELEYPCHSPTEQRWFSMRVVPLRHHTGGMVVSHIDITERVLLENKLTHIYELGHALNLLKDEATIIRWAIEDAYTLIKFTQGGCALFDVKTHTLFNKTYLDEGQWKTSTFCVTADSTQSIIAATYQARRAIYVPDTRQDPRYLYYGASCLSELAVPMIVDDEVIGVLNIEHREAHAFDDTDNYVLQILANQIALALKNTRLITEAEQRAKELSVLHEVDRAITASLDIDSVYQAFTENIARLFPYDMLSIILRDEAKLELAYTADPHGDVYICEDAIQLPHSSVNWVVKQGQPLIRCNLADAPHFDGDDVFQKAHIQSSMMMPLQAKQQTIGVWCMLSHYVNTYHRDNLTIAQSLADQLAIAIYNAQLYQSERERRRQLQESQVQLVQAEKMAALGRLVASVTHEINNPLQAVKGGLHLITEELSAELDDAGLTQIAGLAGQEIDRIVEIVRRMRKFYRPTTSSQPDATVSLDTLDSFYNLEADQLQAIDIHLLMDEVVQLVEKELQRLGIVVQKHWAKDFPPIQGNANHLRQVLLNLTLNAIDAMTDQPQAVLTLVTDCDPMVLESGEVQPTIRLDISDTGTGMSAEVQAQLFEPFVTTKEKGSGLGLFTSYKIIKAHGGHIQVDSQPGAGTTFSIFLPVRQ